MYQSTPAIYPFSFSYSLSDQLTSVTYPTGRTVQYGFDGADRITSVTGPQSKAYVSNILFSPPSIPNTLSLANGLTETYGWNDRLQLTSLNAGSALSLGIFPCDQGATACSSGNIGGTWRETITTNGTLRAVQEFRHDNLNRLYMASEKTGYFAAGPTCPDSGSVWCRQFTFDAPGNRTLSGRSPGGAEAWDVSSFSSTTNRILDSGWSYDAAGNIIGANNAQTSVSLFYDAEDRQVAYCYTYNPNCTNTPGAGVTVYYYDGEGRRVEQVDPTTGTTVFVYDAFGNLAADYGALAPVPTTGTEYVTVDDLGTTRLIIDSGGNVLERHDFEPFGWELAGSEAGWRSSVSGYGVTPTSVRQQFTGQERDGTGLDFFQARYFTGAQGRFASVDPGNAGASLFDPQSWNGYSYVSNSPLAYTDPSGLGFWDDLGGFLGSVISNIMGGWLFGGSGGSGGGIVGGIAGGVNSSQPWNEQLPTGAFGGSLNTGTVFGSGNTGPFVFSFADPSQPAGSSICGDFYCGAAGQIVGALPAKMMNASDPLGNLIVVGGGVKVAAAAGSVAIHLSARGVGWYTAVTGGSGVVLGRYPDYIDAARKMDANVFNIGKITYRVLDFFGEAWTANQQFIDTSVRRGQQIYLSNSPLGQEGSNFDRELTRLNRLGVDAYHWVMLRLPFN